MLDFSRKLMKKHGIKTYSFIKKEKNLFELLSILPNWGVDAKVTGKEWKKLNRPEDYYKITRVNLKQDMEHGRVWGELFSNGELKVEDKQIRHGLKFSWKIYEN